MPRCPSTAGSPSTGRANTIPVIISAAAASPLAAVALGTPPRTSIEYCSALAAAPPPGITREAAVAASWDVATLVQRFWRSVIRSRTHWHQNTPPWAITISCSRNGSRSWTSSQEEKTSRIAGPTR